MMLYKEYLKTTYWKELRKKIVKRDNYNCTVCLTKENLNVHHMTYKRLGKEKIKDLVTLCNRCHTIIHFNSLGEHIKDFLRLKQRLRKMKKNYKKNKNFGLLSRIENNNKIAHPLIQLRWDNANARKL